MIKRFPGDRIIPGKKGQLSYEDICKDNTIYNNGYCLIQVLGISALIAKFGKSFQALLLQWELKSGSCSVRRNEEGGDLSRNDQQE